MSAVRHIYFVEHSTQYLLSHSVANDAGMVLLVTAIRCDDVRIIALSLLLDQGKPCLYLVIPAIG